MRYRLAGAAALSLIVAAPSSGAPQDRPAISVRALVDQVRVPYERFTLPNGLRVLVHTDRKAPVVAVSVWYDVGSRHEPKGKTGFAHLFEHLMFNGSEDAPGDFFEPLKQVGATGYNGSTWYDRTNYYETVPTGALERVLFLESDRMGHLLGAVTQEKLDNQRSVVQNEKRQGDNAPFGLVSYAQSAALFPANHPYGHDTIGSMADLDAASLADVHGWFRNHYAPNNAILILAGDIDITTARPLVEKYFGAFARGPVTPTVAAPVPTLAARVDQQIHDRVATTRLYRTWVVPGLNDPDAVPLSIGAWVLGGLASSRLDNALVRDGKLAVSVSANLQKFALMSEFEVQVDVRPGVDPALVSKRLDALIAQLVREGPTAGEVSRAATRVTGTQVRALEGSAARASTLAQGLLYSGDPDHYRKELAAYASATPAQVRAALRRWLARPVYALTVSPGPREDDATVPASRFVPTGTAAGAGSRAGTGGARADDETGEPVSVTDPTRASDADRSQLPPVGELAGLEFPKVERARLSNGLEIIYARRSAIPVTQISLSFDAGYAADPRTGLGTATLATALLKEGTATLGSTAIAERAEALGAFLYAGSDMDQSVVLLSALSTALAPSLDLFADVALHPAFDPAEIDRMRGQLLAQIAAEASNPEAMATRYMMPALYGTHPYGIPGTGSGTADSVRAIGRNDLLAFYRAWIRPEKARIFVVSDRALAELQPLLEARFGSWRGEGAQGVKSFAVAVPAPRARIVLVDRKDAPQSLIAAGLVLPLRGSDDSLDLVSANDVLGGDFLSRINMDLREKKGWSYGVSARLSPRVDRMAYEISAPVQADRTGAAIAALREDLARFLRIDGVTPAELERTILGNVRQLPGAFEKASAVLGAMQTSELYGRPDDYYARLPDRYRAQTAAGLDGAARAAIDPDRLLWVVVGDAATVRPQLDALGLPVEVIAAP